MDTLASRETAERLYREARARLGMDQYHLTSSETKEGKSESPQPTSNSSVHDNADEIEVIQNED